MNTKFKFPVFSAIDAFVTAGLLMTFKANVSWGAKSGLAAPAKRVVRGEIELGVVEVMVIVEL